VELAALVSIGGLTKGVVATIHCLLMQFLERVQLQIVEFVEIVALLGNPVTEEPA